MIYLCDIDGTIANIDHRLHFIQERPANWKAFFEACPDDEPIWEVLNTVELLWEAGAVIIWVTGRSHEIYPQTVAWINKYTKIPPRRIYMRQEGDHREDVEVKAELLAQVLTEYGKTDAIWGAFEDRQQVVAMYRTHGLRVFQVAPGNF